MGVLIVAFITVFALTIVGLIVWAALADFVDSRERFQAVPEEPLVLSDESKAEIRARVVELPLRVEHRRAFLAGMRNQSKPSAQQPKSEMTPLERMLEVSDDEFHEGGHDLHSQSA